MTEEYPLPPQAIRNMIVRKFGEPEPALATREEYDRAWLRLAMQFMKEWDRREEKS